jgi:hypothetical protein
MSQPPTLRLRLPLPPSTNALYVTVAARGHGATGTRRVSVAAARRFRQAALPVLDRLDGAPEWSATLDLARRGYWGLAVAAYFVSPHRRDLDDVLKLAIDVVSAGLRLADNRLVDLHASKYLAPLEPRLELEINAFADWSFGDERVVLAR